MRPSLRTILLLAPAGLYFAQSLKAADPEGMQVVRSRSTGNASFVSMSNGGIIPVSSNTAAPVGPIDFFRQYGNLFGIRDADGQLKQIAVHQDNIGHIHTEFDQVQGGVRVFGGSLKTHQNDRREFVSVSGEFFPVSPKLEMNPKLDRAAAEQLVLAAFGSASGIIDSIELVIVDPGWYGDRPQGDRLAYYVRVSDWSAVRAEAFFMDAHSGRTIDRWNLAESARNRRIHNAGGSSALPGAVARTEGQAPDDDTEVNRAYDYTGDMYDYYFRAFGRNGFANNGSLMIATVNSTAPSCPNAFWNGTQAVFCAGLTHDDVVAHEFTHAVVQYTAGLIYQNQPGQLNESYADVFGELVDLFNGNSSLPGPPAGPAWPTHGSGPNVDEPNQLRDGCIGGVHLEVLVPDTLAGIYQAGQALFGPALSETGVTGQLVAVQPNNACQPITNPIAGKIALVDRGACNFDLKVSMAEQAGAIAVVVANNREGPLPFLPGSELSVSIPSLGITQAEGSSLRGAMENGPVLVKLAANENSGVRWLVAEDGFGNQFRDMWMPSCLGDPDTANHPFQTCNPTDNGGVHSGSGVPNHAFALVTDGGTYGGYTVDALGPIKSGAVWYRALTYLTEVSDFEDAYAGLSQAALDLVGTIPLDPRTGFPSSSQFTAHDAAQVSLALQAVEMNTPGRCGSFESVLNPEPFEVCDAPVTMYSDGFENGGQDWTVSNTSPPTPYNWVLRGGLPWGMSGSGWFVGDPNIGDCQSSGEAGVHSLTSPLLFVWDEAQEFFLSFTHLVATEPAYDGGNVKISVNEGPFELIPPQAFRYNAYNAAIAPGTNPLAGENAFTGRGAVWGTSFIDLSGFANGGDLVQFRFDFGKDACGGHDGWYLSDIAMFFCVPDGDGDFDQDDKVTLADIAHFQRCMFESVRGGGPCVAGDLDGNGIVNILDFAPMVELLDDP